MYYSNTSFRSHPDGKGHSGMMVMWRNPLSPRFSSFPTYIATFISHLLSNLFSYSCLSPFLRSPIVPHPFPVLSFLIPHPLPTLSLSLVRSSILSLFFVPLFLVFSLSIVLLSLVLLSPCLSIYLSPLTFSHSFHLLYLLLSVKEKQPGVNVKNVDAMGQRISMSICTRKKYID